MPKKPNSQRIVKVIRGPPPVLKVINVTEFQHRCLCAHNYYRAMHCCPPVHICSDMNAFATQWAENLARKDNMESRHFDNYGENLYMAHCIDVDGDLPVKRWYDEIAGYEFAKPKLSSLVRHFTQVIWKNTREIGVGVARRGAKTYVVVNYFPPGNTNDMPELLKQMVPRKRL